jgi:hypothetical protein
MTAIQPAAEGADHVGSDPGGARRTIGRGTGRRGERLGPVPLSGSFRRPLPVAVPEGDPAPRPARCAAVPCHGGGHRLPAVSGGTGAGLPSVVDSGAGAMGPPRSGATSARPGGMAVPLSHHLIGPRMRTTGVRAVDVVTPRRGHREAPGGAPTAGCLAARVAPAAGPTRRRGTRIVVTGGAG